MDGQGHFGTQRIISNTGAMVPCHMSADVDSDGDLDILWGGDSSRIEWFQKCQMG
jgi:hypothetical protein